MKVQVIESYTTEYNMERQTGISIMINGKRDFSMYELCECPEDATFARDLSDCNSIPDMLKRAYEAGVNGETFELTYEEEKD